MGPAAVFSERPKVYVTGCLTYTVRVAESTCFHIFIQVPNFWTVLLSELTIYALSSGATVARASSSKLHENILPHKTSKKFAVKCLMFPKNLVCHCGPSLSALLSYWRSRSIFTHYARIRDGSDVIGLQLLWRR